MQFELFSITVCSEVVCCFNIKDCIVLYFLVLYFRVQGGIPSTMDRLSNTIFTHGKLTPSLFENGIKLLLQKKKIFKIID
jgi:hypothetical protein